MHLLITGAQGQLGRDLQIALRGHDLTALSHADLDVADPDAVTAVVHRAAPDCLINAAAFNDVDGAETREKAAFAVNAAGPGYLAEAAARAGASVVHISTDYVFDGAKGAPYHEEDQPNPLSVYGRSKLEGERRVFAAAPRACVVRTAWLYGLHGKNFVTAILGAARGGQPLRVVADQVGSPTATRDLAVAIRQLIEVGATGLFHVVNRGAISRYEFACAIVRGRVEVIPVTSAESPRPARRPGYSALTSVRLSATGVPQLPPWDHALARFLDSMP